MYILLHAIIDFIVHITDKGDIKMINMKKKNCNYWQIESYWELLISWTRKL